MQHITLICMGKLSESFYADGVCTYEKRLAPYCRFEIIELAEEPLNEKQASAAQITLTLQKEGRRILEAIPKGARMAALCVEGATMDSEGLARWLENAAISGAGSVAFVIGSSHGLAPEVKQRAELKLSLSAMTLPHQLARLVLCEQIYRSFMIRSGSKYHK